MTEQEKIDQFNRDVDDVLKGNAPQAGTDPQRLDAARQLAAADFSTRSRARLTTRARLLARANRELPIQNKRKEMNTRFSNVFRTLAFGAFLLMIVFGLGWVLSNTTPQPAIAPSASPIISPSPLPIETSAADLPTKMPQDNLAGDLFFLIHPISTTANFQWVYFSATCLEDMVDCDMQMLPSLPNGEAIPDTTISWSPDGMRAIFFNSNSTSPLLYELSATTGEWRAIPVDFWLVNDKYFWAFTSQWIAFQAQGEEDQTSYISFFNPETNEFRKSDEVPGEERKPVSWLSEDELIVQVLKYAPDGSGNNPVGRYVLLNIQTGLETEYHRFDSLGSTTLGSDDVLSPDNQWWASPVSRGLQTEIVLMRGDGSENHTVFKADGRLSGSVIWLNSNYLFVRLYNETDDRNHLYLVSLTDNTTREIFLPRLETSAFDVSQVSFRPNTDPLFSRNLAETFPSSLNPVQITSTPFDTYAVQVGDTLTKIAVDFDLSVDELLSLNGLTSDTILRVGQVLIVPAKISTQPSSSSSSTYTVQEGDTLFKIASDFGLTVEMLMSLNGLPTDTILVVGQVLMVRSTMGEPDTSLEIGEIYLSLSKASGYETAGLLHFPASCLISGKPCPQPEFVQDLPSSVNFPEIVWSPDRTKMVYAVRKDQVWLFDLSTQSWMLLDIPFIAGIQWSPDGKQFVGSSGVQSDGRSTSLIVVSADGGEYREILLDRSGFKQVAGWLNEHQIVIETPGINNSMVIKLYDLQTNESSEVAEFPWDPNIYMIKMQPLSPDRTQLVYGLLQDKSTGPMKIIVLNLNDGSWTTFSPAITGFVSWSPDNQWLVINSSPDTSCEIHLIRSDGSDEHSIFNGDWNGVCSYTWSPDGQTLLVPALAQTPTIPRLYVINVATGESRLVELPDVGVEFEWPVVSWVP